MEVFNCMVNEGMLGIRFRTRSALVLGVELLSAYTLDHCFFDYGAAHLKST